MTTPAALSRRVVTVALTASTLAFAFPSHAANNGYQVTNLVTNPTSGLTAAHQDANLVNAWGIAFNPTAFSWVADNGSGKATLYDGSGNANPLVVTIPSANGTDTGTPTGIVFNGGSSFNVTKAGVSAPARFIFVSEDGVISGWAPTLDMNNALPAMPTQRAVYKGVTIAANGTAQFLYAADLIGHKIDVFDASFQPAGAFAGKFKDPNIPANYGPFNVQNILGNLYVTYAKTQPGSNDEAHGQGLGFVDVYDADGNLLQHLVQHGQLNAPWGVALAPSGFGKFGNRLLVGNFGDGTINAYDPHTGTFKGTLKGTDGKALQIDGLWALVFGNGFLGQPTDTLFFSSGPHDENDGLYGRIEPMSPTAGDMDDSDDD
jgi:uncharacterized protein (TIGR03118 family)